ncbi:MAG TPA: tetratricopeptide repeat protein, partial [Caulobacteraceae bacterium]|nr:tetratricopeptide repeat protein [Caulobacteraceae bacterium]
MQQGSEGKGSGAAGPVWAGRVEALRRAGRMDDAIGILRARVRDAPSDISARVWLGETLLAANRPDLALEAFVGALRAGEPVSGALCGQGSALAALGRPAEAALAFSAAVGLDAEDAPARHGLALLAFEAGDVEAAAAHLARFAGAGPPPAVWLAARVALARGDLAGAAAIVQRLAALPDLDQ